MQGAGGTCVERHLPGPRADAPDRPRAGCYSFSQSNLVNTLSGQTVNGWYVLGTLGIIYSWGLHVGCWIQKQNGK